MKKIVTPQEILWNEISKDKFLVEIIDALNNELTASELKQEYAFTMITSEDISYSQINLLRQYFKLFQWNVTFSHTFQIKDDNYKNVFTLTPLTH